MIIKKDVLFNAKMIGKNECTMGVIAPLVDDFLNHLAILSGQLMICEYNNAVVLLSKQSDSTLLMLALVANSYDKDRTAGIVNCIHSRLEQRNIFTWYRNLRDDVFDCEQYFSRENEDAVLALRKDLVANVLAGEYKYHYATRLTREEIIDGVYEIPSRYEIQASFMDVLRGVTAMPRKSMICGDDLREYLNNEERQIIDAKPTGVSRYKENEITGKAFVATLDGNRLDVEDVPKPTISFDDENLNDGIDSEIIKSALSPVNFKNMNARQTTIDDFDNGKTR